MPKDVECDKCGASFQHPDAERVVGMQCVMANCPGHYRLRVPQLHGAAPMADETRGAEAESEIDDMLREFQSACEDAAFYHERGRRFEVNRAEKERAILRNSIRAKLIENAALLAERERLTRQRDAWREFAEHAAHCVECGEMSVESCDDGRRLQNDARYSEWDGPARASWRDERVTVLRVEDGEATIIVDGYEASNTVSLVDLVIEYPPAAPSDREPQEAKNG